MKPTVSMVLLLGSIVCFNAACKKGGDDNTVTPPPVTQVDSGQIYFHLHTYVGDNEVDLYNITYTLDNGRQISLSEAQMYISGIQLVKPNGTTYNLSNVTLLKTLENESYYVAKVPVDTYKSVKFYVGLDATTNQKTPSGSSSDILNHPEMWFSSTAQPGGYIFMNVSGKIDTTAGANGTTAQMQPFTYHIGTDAHYTQVSMPDHSPYYVVTKDQIEYIHMIIDYSGLFNGLQLNNSSNLSVLTKTDNSTPLGNTITANIPGMFRYEE